MSVLNVQWPQTGQVPNTTTTSSATSLPSVMFIQTNDLLDDVLVSNYLNTSRLLFGNIYSNSQMALVYTTDSGCVWLRVVVAGNGTSTTYSLQTPSQGPVVIEKVEVENGTAAAPSITFVNDLDSGFYRIGANNIGLTLNGALEANFSTTSLVYGGGVYAGLSGTAGTLRSYPATASRGYFEVTGVANVGDTAFVLTNASMGQATTATIPDPGNAAARILTAAGATPFVSGNLVKSSGTGGLVVDGGYKILSGTTTAYAGGGTSNAFTATGLTSAYIVTAVILTSTNAVSIAKAVPGTNTLTVTFSADPGADTTVSWIATSAAAS